jgi:hypothetical protein
MLDLLLEHMHLGIEELVFAALVRLDLGDQQLGRVMLDIAFLEQVFFHRNLASGVENLLLDLGMDGKLEADFARQLFLAAVAFRVLELLEQLFDLAVVFLQQRDRVLRLGLGHDASSSWCQSSGDETIVRPDMFLRSWTARAMNSPGRRDSTGRASAISPRSSACSCSARSPGRSPAIPGGICRC